MKLKQLIGGLIILQWNYIYGSRVFSYSYNISAYSTELPGANNSDRHACEEQIHLIYPFSCEEEKTVSKWDS